MIELKEVEPSFAARELVKNPDILERVQGKFLIVSDTGKGVNFVKAMNILDERGWELVQASATHVLIIGIFKRR